VAKPIYDFVSHTRRSATDPIRPGSIILVEGLFALWDAKIRSTMDLKIYVDAEADFRFIRRLRRDVLERGRTINAVVEQYLASVRPMHRLYIEPTKAFADVVLQNNGTEEELFTTAGKVLSKVLGSRE
jgi:uridine kinase